MTQSLNAPAFELPDKVFFFFFARVRELFSFGALSCFPPCLCAAEAARRRRSRGRQIYLPPPDSAHVLPAHPSFLCWLCRLQVICAINYDRRVSINAPVLPHYFQLHRELK